MSDDPREWLRTLDVIPGATLEEVRRSYRELAKVWHPDRFAHDTSLLRKAHEKMNQLNDAYQQVCALVERFGAEALSSGSTASFSNGDRYAEARNRAGTAERSEITPPMASFARAGDSFVRLTWSPVYGAGSYHVKRSEGSGGPYSTVARDVAWTEYVDRSVVNGTRYFYVVCSVDGSQESKDSAELIARPLETPSAPTDLTALILDNGRGVQLQWRESASPEIGWNIVYRAEGGMPFVQIAQVSAGASYLDRHRSASAACKYAVSAVNFNGQQSAHSVECVAGVNAT